MVNMANSTDIDMGFFPLEFATGGANSKTAVAVGGSRRRGGG